MRRTPLICCLLVLCCERLQSLMIPVVSQGRAKLRHPLTLAASKADLIDFSSAPSFEYLKSLDERCETLSKLESEFMLSFWSEKLQCFQIFPNLTTNRVSITTTCIALRAIASNPLNWQNTAVWQELRGVSTGGSQAGKISIKSVVEAIKNAPWTGDTYQTQLIVSTLCSFGNLRERDEEENGNYDSAKFTKAVEMLLEDRARVSLHRKQNLSAYLRHQQVRALLALVNSGSVPPSVTGLETEDSIGYVLERANLVAFDELCRQLAFYNSGDSANFDVIILAYSLLSYWETSTSLYLSSFARGVVPTTNIKLVKAALAIIFSEQSLDGTWRKGEPINKAGRGDGRDIGNQYVFFFDMVASLLGIIGEQQPQLLAPYLTQLERCITWAEANIQQELLVEHDASTGSWDTARASAEAIPSTSTSTMIAGINNQPQGPTVKGWRSNHLGTGGAVAWCTAQVFLGLSNMRRLLHRLITTSILDEFGGIAAASPQLRILECSAASTSGSGSGTGRASSKEWIGLMDADLELAGAATTLKTEIHSRLLAPLEQKEKELLNSLFGRSVACRDVSQSTGEEASSTGQQGGGAAQQGQQVTTEVVQFNQPVYSAILFGPPGTAKTTICTSMAKYLGWNFLTIDTACFLADGLENIASRMSYIFDRLSSLERTIILFDEIEEFCLDRENPALGMESRMLTTAMLTQLNDLRRQQLSVFIVATNRLRSFDAAVTRPGRFDMLLFVGTPNLSARTSRLEGKLRASATSGRTIDQIQHTLECFHNYMRDNWETVRFLTFAENESLLRAIVDFTISNQLTEDVIKSKVAALLRTSTIQGAVKEEYVLSEAMSRV